MTTEQQRAGQTQAGIWFCLYPMSLCVLLAPQLFVWVRDKMTQDYKKQIKKDKENKTEK